MKKFLVSIRKELRVIANDSEHAHQKVIARLGELIKADNVITYGEIGVDSVASFNVEGLDELN